MHTYIWYMYSKLINWMFGTYKRCYCCKKYVLVEMFGISNGELNENCRPCNSIRSRVRYQKHKELYQAKGKVRYEHDPKANADRNKSYRFRNPHRVWAGAVKHSHLGHGIEVRTDIDFIHKLALSNPVCNMCGRELNYGQYTKNGKVGANSPTVDRIGNEPYLGEDNIWIICHDCNSTKRTRTFDEFVEYCKYIVEHEKQIRKRLNPQF
jgi:hypothetical protein